MRSGRPTPLAAAVLLAVVTTALVGCGGGGGSDEAASTTTAPELPAACVEAPLQLDLRAGGERPAGSEQFEVADAVVLRTPILPNEMAFDGSGLAGLQSKAEITPLAAYSLFLSDQEIDRGVITGRDLGRITPEAGQTIGVLSMVPVVETGLAQGDVVVDGELGYEAVSSFRPLSLTVFTDGDATGQPYTDVVGQAEVLQLSDDTMCVAFDVTFENQGQLVYAGTGTVAAPVVRSGAAFFFT